MPDKISDIDWLNKSTDSVERLWYHKTLDTQFYHSTFQYMIGFKRVFLVCRDKHLMFNLLRKFGSFFTHKSSNIKIRFNLVSYSIQMCFRHVEGVFGYQLGHGSLLVMMKDTQKYWLHSVPKQKSIQNPRINLTFRKS